MNNPPLPVELWIRIIRFATINATSPDLELSLESPFDLETQGRLRRFDIEYDESMQTKVSLSIVCRTWNQLLPRFLWETIRILPGRRFHQIGAIIQRDQRRHASGSASQDNKPIGHLVRALHIRDTSSSYGLFDFANIERIVHCCPNLITITTPRIWQMFKKDFHISCHALQFLQEVSLAVLDEPSIQRLTKTNKKLRIIHGSNILIQYPPSQDLTLSSVHTLSIRLSDMEDRRIFAPLLRRWIIHDNIDEIGATHTFQLHADLVTILELSCGWTDHVKLQQSLLAMKNLQDLIIHLEPENWNPVPHLLPPQIKRLGFSCPYPCHDWIFDSDREKFQWFHDTLEDWINVAFDAVGHLKTIRFIDWPYIRLPTESYGRVRDAYVTSWQERLVWFSKAGVIIEDQDGNPLTIEA